MTQEKENAEAGRDGFRVLFSAGFRGEGSVLIEGGKSRPRRRIYQIVAGITLPAGNSVGLGDEAGVQEADSRQIPAGDHRREENGEDEPYPE